MNHPFPTDPQETAEELEAYCVRDRQRVPISDPTPVWTSKGQPATRGDCPICGGPIFRLGNTPAHDNMTRPQAVNVNDLKGKRAKLAPESVYIAYEAADTDFAMQLAGDLERLRMAHWLHDPAPDGVNWAGGVHPALKECGRMVLVASPSSVDAADVEAAWTFFRDKKKLVAVAQLVGTEPPDPLRRAPRFDFSADYKSAFRGLLATLNEKKGF